MSKGPLQLRAGAHDILRQILQHKLLTLRAVVVGWLAVLALWIVLASRLARIDDWLFRMGVADIRAFWRGGSAWFSHFLIGGMLNAAAGWIVGRLHRPHRVAMVSAFFLSFVVIADFGRVLGVVQSARNEGTPVWQGLWIALLDFVFMTIPILVAGIWGVRDGPFRRHR